MKQYFSKIDRRTREGETKLECQDAEDMWHVYNLLAVGDSIRATTFRKVTSETDTGSSTARQKKLTLTIQVTKISYDAAAARIRVTGQNCSQSEFIRIGAYHTVELEPHRAFTLIKACWDSEYTARLKTALDPHTDADLAAVMMHEGLAHILLVSRSLTLTRARIECAIPRKGANALYNRGASIVKFFDVLLAQLKAHIDLNAVKVVLLASPGFVKDEFFKHICAVASRTDDRTIIDNKSKFVLTHSSSGQRHAFNEVLQRPELQKRLSATKAIGEVKALKRFFDMLSQDETRAVYGPTHVLYAGNMGAIDTLLVTDALFRSVDVETRKKYVALVENTRKAGATVIVFSDQHVSGAQLKQMSGVAAILRYPLPEIDDLDADEEVVSSDEETASSEASPSDCETDNAKVI